jgi:hypothetical protein
VPLRFDPGEAYQFDWSHEAIELHGLPLTVKLAQMRLLAACRSCAPIFARRRRWCSPRTIAPSPFMAEFAGAGFTTIYGRLPRKAIYPAFSGTIVRPWP